MKTTGLNLLISDKADVERDSAAQAFARGGGAVQRIGRFWDPPAFDPPSVRVYGADSFCLVLQQKLGFDLCSPNDDLLLHVPPEFLKRTISRQSLDETRSITFAAFIKPVTPKQFRGAVYVSYDQLAAECRGLPANTAVFVSEPVTLKAEARMFVKDGQVLDASIYEGKEEKSEAMKFFSTLTKSMSLPRTLVVDVGFIDGRGWAVVEFNAAWGAGLNGCDADRVLPAIVAASEPVTY